MLETTEFGHVHRTPHEPERYQNCHFKTGLALYSVLPSGKGKG